MKVTVPPENSEAIQNLQPSSLWAQFATISSIPRPSKQEDAILSYIKAFAEERNLTWKQDQVGNLVVRRPGTGSGKNAPAVILQGHVDMVTEKNSDSAHDFATDPILLQRVQEDNGEGWLKARGTTLGADNGIGVAAILALLDSPPSSTSNLPPLEALFTVDEETGLTGAQQLDATLLDLTGKTLLNLDTEEWPELYVGCAGGGETRIQLSIARDPQPVKDLVEVRVEGLMGGHSGINIHEGRANAILLCARAAHAALQTKGVALVSLEGGDKHNAIPREARAVLSIDPEARGAVEEAVTQSHQAAWVEYGTLETNLQIRLVDTNECSRNHPLDQASASRLLSMLLALPHGPLKLSHAIPDLVETSNNVASVTMSEEEEEDDDNKVTILCSTRSSISTALESARDRLSAIAFLAGAAVQRSAPYPGWNPNPQSPLLHMAKKILEDKNGRAPGVKAIHAGLECGLLIEKLGGNVDALSFGPTIEGAHSPDERILTGTVPPFFELVKDILAELAQKRDE